MANMTKKCCPDCKADMPIEKPDTELDWCKEAGLCPCHKQESGRILDADKTEVKLYESPTMPLITPTESGKCCDQCKDYEPCYKISCPGCHAKAPTPPPQADWEVELGWKHQDACSEANCICEIGYIRSLLSEAREDEREKVVREKIKRRSPERNHAPPHLIRRNKDMTHYSTKSCSSSEETKT